MHIRRLLAAALLAALLPALAPAQRRVPPVRRPSAQQQDDEGALKQLVREWADAVVHADLQKLDRIQADNFSGDSEGKGFNKRSLREALRTGMMKVAAWTIDDVEVTFQNPAHTVAVVKGKSTLTNAVFMGQDFSGEYEWTDRLVKQKDGAWRAVTSHSKRVKK